MRVRHVTLLFAPLLALLFGGKVAAAPVDYVRDIRPIFVEHCLGCHDAGSAAGGLDLETRAGAERAGASGVPVLTLPLETNELVRRLVSDDPGYRMPRSADPLPTEAVALITSWIEAGAPWPEDAVTTATGRSGPFVDRDGVWGWIFQRQIRPVLPAIFGVVILMLLVERLRARPWAQALHPIRPNHGLLVIAVLLIAHQFRSTGELRAEVVDVVGPTRVDFGDPPVPRRPDHVRRLAGTYYRGNCERSDELFNGGNYATCLFHVALCDSNANPLEVGSPIPHDGLYVQIEVERAPGTVDALFRDEIMEGMFLSTEVFDHEPARFDAEKLLPFEVVEKNWRWRALYPVDLPLFDEGSSEGLIYFYRRIRPEPAQTSGEVRATPHYGLKFDLAFEEGRIGPRSEVWMGALYITAVVGPPPPVGKVPFDHWFDDRPIPLISGENTDDPDLLGVPEHAGGAP